MYLGIYGRFGDSPQSWSAAAANADKTSHMHAVQDSITDTLCKTVEQMQIDKGTMLEELSRQHAEVLRKEQENLHQQMRKQQQVYEELQSAMFTKMAAQEEIFPKTEEEMMERMKMQQDLYQQQQA